MRFLPSPRGLAVFLLISLLASSATVSPGRPRAVALVKSRSLTPYNLAAHGARAALTNWDPTVQIQEFDLPMVEQEERKFLDGLERQRPDLIVTVGTHASRSVAQRVHNIPIVVSLVLADGGSEAVFTRWPSNVTGAAMDVPPAAQFAKLREVIPVMRRAGVIYNPRETGKLVAAAREAAAAAGLFLVELPISSEGQVMKEVDDLKGKVDVLWSVADSTVFTPRSIDYILLSTLRDGIPFVGLSPSFVQAGALVSLSCDYEDVGSQAGEIAVEILKGARPQDLPVVHPRHVSLFLNLNTARAIRLEIPEKIRAESQVRFKR